MPRNENGSNTEINEEPRTTINNDAILNAGQFATRATQLNPQELRESLTSSMYSAEPAFDFPPVPMPKVHQHELICHDLNRLYERKNHDYGDSFERSFDEYGLTMAAIRLDDKLNRLKSFIHNGTMHVPNEPIEDTLMDLANYSIMTLIELNNHR